MLAVFLISINAVLLVAFAVMYYRDGSRSIEQRIRKVVPPRPSRSVTARRSPPKLDTHWIVEQEKEIWGWEFTKCVCTKCEMLRTMEAQRLAIANQEVARRREREEYLERLKNAPRKDLAVPTTECVVCGQRGTLNMCLKCNMQIQRPSSVPAYAHVKKQNDGTGFGFSLLWTWTDPETGKPMGVAQAVGPFQLDAPNFDVIERKSNAWTKNTGGTGKPGVIRRRAVPKF